MMAMCLQNSYREPPPLYAKPSRVTPSQHRPAIRAVYRGAAVWAVWAVLAVHVNALQPPGLCIGT